MYYDKNNIFARMLRKEISGNIAYEDDLVLALHDIAPVAPVHILVLPKLEYQSFNDFVKEANPSYVADFFAAVQKVAELFGLEKSGYRLLMNHGENALQTVGHFHVHILGGKKLGRLIRS
jgi:histidine triad (HIT) family protein